MADRLPVFWADAHVGDLDRGGDGRMYFAYSATWLARTDSAAISQSLPLGDALYQEAGHRWFANLLPEGAAREAVAHALGVSADDDFGLLEALGRDVAGALTLGEPRSHGSDSWLRLDDDAANRWARGAPALSDAIADGARLSLAGAQQKIGVRRVDNDYFVSDGTGASTHILKFCPRGMAHVPENEFFSMQLAHALGLTVAQVELETRWARPVLVVERFDRVAHDRTVNRVHQEDACQALGVSRLDKYRVALSRVVEVVRATSSAPARDVHTLLQWQAFNALCGNDDGHGKNVSLVLEGGPRLAPCYDLVCTAAIARLSRKLAMPIGDCAEAGNLAPAHWAREEEALGLRSGAFRRVGDALLADLPNALDAASEALARRAPSSPVLDRVRQAIEKRSRRVAGSLIS